MGKFLKVIGGLLLALVLLVVAAAIILPMVIDPNDYKDEIITQVNQQTGRELKIEGDLKLSVFPWLGVDIGGLELSNAEGFGEQPFAVVNSAGVRVKLMPLLSRELEVDTVVLNGLMLNLAKAKDGRTNWDDLVKGAGEEKPAPTESGEGKGLAGFRIGGVDISDATIRWDDRSSGQQYAVEQFFLKSGAITSGSPVSLELGAQLQSKAPEMTAQVNLQGTVSLDEAAGLLSIQGLDLELEASSPELKQGAVKANLGADVTMALNGQSLSVDGLNITAADLKLSGNLKGSNLNSQPAFSGSLALAEFNLRSWLDGQGIEVPETADPEVLTRVAAQFELANQGATTRVDKLQIGLDDTRISGNASVKGEAIGFALELDKINADRYLPPVKEETAKTEQAAEGPKATGDEPLFPVETLRGLNLNGSLKIGELIINKLTARDIQVAVKANNGKLSLDNSVGAFYQGSYKGLVNLDVSGKTPQLRTDNQASSIQAGPMLQDLTGKDKFDGKGNFQANLTGSGNSVNAIKRSLNGNLDFRFEDGAVKGFNLAQMIREGQAKLKGESLPKDTAPPQTDFSEMSGSAVVRQGVLDNQDLLAKSPFLRVTGAGKVNLVNETLDYLVKPVIVSTAAGQGGEGLEDLKGVPIPVKMTGPYADPKFSIDWAQVATGTQKAKLEEKKAEVKQQLEEKKQEAKEQLEDKLKDKLKGFFN